MVQRVRMQIAELTLGHLKVAHSLPHDRLSLS